MAFRYANGMTKEEYKAYYNALPDPQKTLSLDEWSKYRDMLARINNKAADEFRDAVFNVNGRWKGVGLGKIPADELIEYAYGLTTKYGEASGALAAEMYDEIAEASGVVVPAAAPAETASFSEVAKTVNGVLKQSLNEEMLAGAIERLTKLPAEDTMIQNSARDGAELAWIPHGDTCAFCITLASRGWQPASQKMLRNGHAEHVHGHCDCTHAVRFNDSMKVEGYNPDAYLRMYYGADLDGERATPKNRINAMRREIYQHNKDEINAQKRSAYAKQQEREASKAEEADIT